MAAGISATRHHQQGLALITAVLVVAIVATVATTLALGEQVWFRQAQNMNNRAQAESLRRGALNYAAILLARDDAKIDHLGEEWAKPAQLPVEDGMIAFAVQDAQSRFNLNNLVQKSAPSKPDIELFKRLLTSQGIDPGLSEALLDWLDTDGTVSPGGAEDIEYLSLPQPYRSANQLLQSVDELRLVKGFTAKAVEKLRPFVTALPTTPTTVNVNTAPAEVLAALFTNLPATVLRPLLDSRINNPYTELKQFTDKLPVGTSSLPPNMCDIKTGHFLVTIDIRYGRLQRRTEGLIERAGGKPAKVLWHRLPPLQIETSPDEKT
ncbi:MAG TPA: type II secretion system minor pseudopilin GspK [Acidiferrobacterales bacterium]|nr:type II secretion system minor pseudopilin GspK [Acidiferrobacterales bacterium]